MGSLASLARYPKRIKSLFDTKQLSEDGKYLGVGCTFFFIFTPIPGEMIQFDLRIFFKWVGEKPPTRYSVWLFDIESEKWIKAVEIIQPT